MFTAGADKVSINSAAIARPELIGEIGGSFGAQAVIVAIDARRGEKSPEEAEVYVAGGAEAEPGRRVVEWAREAEQRGAGEILLTSMDTGRDARGVRAANWTAAVSAGGAGFRLIASGGAGSAATFRRCVREGQGGRGAGGEYLPLRGDGFARTEGPAAAASWHQHAAALLMRR